MMVVSRVPLADTQMWKCFVPFCLLTAKEILFCFVFLQLFEAVNCLAKDYARLLVLGRKHMLTNSFNWKREVMKEMQNKADFFFAENM